MKTIVVVELVATLGVEILIVVVITVSVVLSCRRCWNTSCSYLSCSCSCVCSWTICSRSCTSKLELYYL